MKLGKLPATADSRDLRFARYRTAFLPKRPRSLDHSGLFKNWGELGNDLYGNCVLAGGDHETMVWTAEGGQSARFSIDTALADYSAVTGFDRQNPGATDLGTNVRDALLYRQKIGLIDVAGNRHKLGAFVALDPKNLDQICDCIYLFSAVGVGIEMPESAEEQFGYNQAWTVVKGSRIAGGHYVPVVGYRRNPCGLTLNCITWGKPQAMTADFLAEYCDEAWGLLSPEMLRSGKSPEGFDMTALQADLEKVRK